MTDAQGKNIFTWNYAGKCFQRGDTITVNGKHGTFSGLKQTASFYTVVEGAEKEIKWKDVVTIAELDAKLTHLAQAYKELLLLGWRLVKNDNTSVFYAVPGPLLMELRPSSYNTGVYYNYGSTQKGPYLGEHTWTPVTNASNLPAYADAYFIKRAIEEQAAREKSFSWDTLVNLFCYVEPGKPTPDYIQSPEDHKKVLKGLLGDHYREQGLDDVLGTGDGSAEEAPGAGHTTNTRPLDNWSFTASSLDDDHLPDMTGFEPATLGAGEHTWFSSAYLLADRDLSVGEHVHAWLVSEQDGRILKTVAWKATATEKAKADWPKAFLTAVDEAPAIDGYKWICAGHLADAGGLDINKVGSPTTEAFAALSDADKDAINRLWHYGSGCRLFTNAPFQANQVIAGRVPDIAPPAGESVSVQVRDRTSLHLYETYLYTPPAVHDDTSVSAWSKGLCDAINAKAKDGQYGMLRAGGLDDDKVTVTSADSGNALWVAQHSNLSVELDALTWQKHRAVAAFKPTEGAVIQFHLYDRYSTGQLPGSPFSYTVKKTDSDAQKCLVSLKKALAASPLGSYLCLAAAKNPGVTPTTASEWALWLMPLPVRLTVIGVPGLTGDYEKALETSDGKALSLSELYDGYKDGVALTLTDRWSGHSVETWTFTPSQEQAKTQAQWLKALGGKVASSVPEWGEAKTRATMPSETTTDFSKHFLWLPQDAEWVVIAKQLQKEKSKLVGVPHLMPRLMSVRNMRIVEEAVGYATSKTWSNTSGFNKTYAKLIHWGGEVLNERDCDQMRARRGEAEYNSQTATYKSFQFKAPSADTAALLCIRLSEDDMSYPQKDVWEFRFHDMEDYVLECLSCTESKLTLKYVEPEGFEQQVHALILLMAYRAGEVVVEPEDFLQDSFELKSRFIPALRDLSVYSSLRDLEVMNLFVADVKCLRVLAEAALDLVAKIILMRVLFEGKFLSPIKSGNHKKRAHYDYCGHHVALKVVVNSIVQELYDAIGFDGVKKLKSVYLALPELHYDTPRFYQLPEFDEKIKKAVAEVKKHMLEKRSGRFDPLLARPGVVEAVGARDVYTLRSLMCTQSTEFSSYLHLQLTRSALDKGIRYISFTSHCAPDILATVNSVGYGGIRLHIPDEEKISGDAELCAVSYVSRSGIDSACWTMGAYGNPHSRAAATIQRPFMGKEFVVADSLCADYAGTLGSEVYDVSGASENGVDPKTGLFHAHYPVGVIRGLSGKGPEIDLTLHYSATRANESALGDGWAFRFSAYDNYAHRLTLSNGQTITLTDALATQARKAEGLSINGVTLTGAKGTFNELTGLTVTFPSGRTETLARPHPYDGKEPNENYKKAFLTKIGSIKNNLEQWLKEPGITAEHETYFNAKLEQINAIQKDKNRKVYTLVPTSITSPQGGTLTLKWQGKEGHIFLTSIADGKTTLLKAAHGTPVAKGSYSSTFTVWPETDEAYEVTLTINDCLLTCLTRKGEDASAPVQTVKFGYEREPVLDRVLCWVAEEDGSIEAVSYAPNWKNWDLSDAAIPLSRVLRHTLVPGAGQQTISHIWEYEGNINQMGKPGQTYSATCSLETGSAACGPLTRRTWALKNGFLLETQVIQETPGVVRETTTMVYPDSITSTDPNLKFRLATQPVSTTVTTEDLRLPSRGATVADSAAESAKDGSRS
ncbi:hypothetical protein SHV42_21600 [Pseudomonas capeferrum]|uniref:hypothetical protein n=1 Tax=Pseudomonas capeferrum TaxID=1495066 RepID=UPI00397B749C